MDNEARLKQIEAELEVIYLEIEELENTEPPYDPENPQASFEKYKAHYEPSWSEERKLNREKRMLVTPEFSALSDYGDVMSLKDFKANVACGGFIDYDGFGHYIRDGKESDIDIYPSDIKHNSVRDDFDTIIWFNR